LPEGLYIYVKHAGSIKLFVGKILINRKILSLLSRNSILARVMLWSRFMSVCLSVCLSKPVFDQNDYKDRPRLWHEATPDLSCIVLKRNSSVSFLNFVPNFGLSKNISPRHADCRKYCQLFFDDCRTFITLSVHLCAQRDRHDAARRRGLSLRQLRFVIKVLEHGGDFQPYVQIG